MAFRNPRKIKDDLREAFNHVGAFFTDEDLHSVFREMNEKLNDAEAFVALDKLRIHWRPSFENKFPSARVIMSRNRIEDKPLIAERCPACFEEHLGTNYGWIYWDCKKQNEDRVYSYAFPCKCATGERIREKGGLPSTRCRDEVYQLTLEIRKNEMNPKPDREWIAEFFRALKSKIKTMVSGFGMEKPVEKKPKQKPEIKDFLSGENLEGVVSWN
jgi:hypothetical protein